MSWFSARRTEREALLKTLETLQAVAIAQAEAAKDQAKVLTAFLDSFKVSEPPISRVTRDEDEWEAEVERDAARAGRARYSPFGTEVHTVEGWGE